MMFSEQEGPDLSPLLHGLRGAATEGQQEAAALSWRKAEAYYFGSVARLQRLSQVSPALARRQSRWEQPTHTRLCPD